MLKNISKLECTIGDKTIQLFCDMDTPTSHVKEALFQFGKFIGHIEDEVKKLSEKTNIEPIEQKIEA